MSVILQTVLDTEDLARVHAELDAAAWSPGKVTAGPAASALKNNLQVLGDNPRLLALGRFVQEALQRHPMFDIAARPARQSRILFSRYEPGMAYGAHTDDALMGRGEDRLRTDLAFTLFLAEPSAYEGGALVVHSALGEQQIKLEAGDAILYPANSIHGVAPVTKGVRLAAVGWVQSLVPDAGRREILFDLSVLRAELSQGGAARETLVQLDKSVSNLLRMWAQI